MFLRQGLTPKLELAIKPQGSSFLPHYWDCRCVPLGLAFYMGARSLGLGPQTCKSTLPTEPSPQATSCWS